MTHSLLDQRKRNLELCAYCPKLCRAACPVSNAEQREALIPWGKMTTAYLVARGDFKADSEQASTAWACTGCLACRQNCDHRNEVAATLVQARQSYFEQGLAPAAAKRVSEQYETTAAEYEAAINLYASQASEFVSPTGVPLLIGCAYGRFFQDESILAIKVAATLLGERVRPLTLCCGRALRDAGDETSYLRARANLIESIGSAQRIVALDPGCVGSLVAPVNPGETVFHIRPTQIKVDLLIKLAAEQLDRLSPLPKRTTPVRYHDPCKLGRGLGVYREPRAILTRLLGAPPAEFLFSGEQSHCSGAGGLLPLTMPETSKAITTDRLAEHADHGGGELVTACASSLRAFRDAGAQASDLISLIASGLALQT